MKQKKEEQVRVRKAYSPKGERGQKPMSFRIDLENLEWLERQANKGRAINKALQYYRIHSCEAQRQGADSPHV